MSKQIVLFARGNKAVYATYSPEEKARKVYFALDTNEIIVNNVVFGINLKDVGVDLVAQVEQLNPTQIKVTKTNGKTSTITFPVATLTSNGLLSKEDKKKLDEIPDKYATKEELAESVTKIYRYKGTVPTFDGLPTTGQKSGDTYNVEVGFELNDKYYPANTNVAWVEGTPGYWDPLGGIDDAYTKEEVDLKFIAWTDLEGGKRLLVMPKGTKIMGTTAGNTWANLLQLGVYDDVLQTEVGSTTIPLCLNSSTRPAVDLPGGEKQYLAYLQDSGVLDMSKYPSNATIGYIYDFPTEYVTENGTPSEINGERYNADTNNYTIGEDYLVVNWKDEAGTKRYSLYSGLLPNSTDAAITELRKEMISYLTWEESTI